MDDPEWWSGVIGAYNHYQAGYLPHSGGMNDQCCLFPEIIGIIDAVAEECRERQDKQSRDRQAPSADGSVSLLGKR